MQKHIRPGVVSIPRMARRQVFTEALNPYFDSFIRLRSHLKLKPNISNLNW